MMEGQKQRLAFAIWRPKDGWGLLGVKALVVVITVLSVLPFALALTGRLLKR